MEEVEEEVLLLLQQPQLYLQLQRRQEKFLDVEIGRLVSVRLQGCLVLETQLQLLLFLLHQR